MTGTVIKRDELYEEVWSAAVRKVAKKYGISDVALAKICRKLNVPMPGLGYWARVAAGAKLDRTPLPPPKPGQPLEYRIEGRQDPLVHPEAGDEARALIERENDPAMQEVIPAELTKPHPLVRASAPLLRRKRRKGGSVLTESACLDIAAVGETLERALRVADTLLKALERRGLLRLPSQLSQETIIQECKRSPQGQGFISLVSSWSSELKRTTTSSRSSPGPKSP